MFELEEVHMVVRMVPRSEGWTVRDRQWHVLKDWCFVEELLCCGCVRFDLFSNLWYFGVTWIMMLGLISDT